MEKNWIRVNGILQPGHQVASGKANNSPYPQGTIEMQMPFFQQLGIDLKSFFLGTLNISISPYLFKIKNPEYTFDRIQWNPEYPAETFSFSRCQIIFQAMIYDAWIYYPHPETKIGHFQDNSTLEIIAPKILGINYGDRVELEVNTNEISIVCDR